MNNRKFKITSKEHSIAIQKRLFQLGYGWPGEYDDYVVCEIRYVDEPALIAFDDQTICWANLREYEEDDSIPSTLDDLYMPYE